MAYTDLRDFEQEYEHTDPDTGLHVQLEKLGGGTLGRTYTGNWRYIITTADGIELARGQDLTTPLPRTHAQAAVIALDYFTD